jgi:GH24 family phage-related lysozyme (muramidase)
MPNLVDADWYLDALNALSEPWWSHEFLLYIITLEGTANYQDGVFKPYPSLEGGTKTIAYGHKLSRSEAYLGTFAHGLNMQEALALLQKDLIDATLFVMASTADDLAASNREWSDLTMWQREVLTEFTFNLGPSFKRKFPKFTAAVLMGNRTRACKECQRFYTNPAGETKPLTTRNEATRLRYFPDEVPF